MKKPRRPRNPPRQVLWLWTFWPHEHALPVNTRMKKLAKFALDYNLGTVTVRWPKPEEWGEEFEDGTGI